MAFWCFFNEKSCTIVQITRAKGTGHGNINWADLFAAALEGVENRMWAGGRFWFPNFLKPLMCRRRRANSRLKSACKSRICTVVQKVAFNGEADFLSAS